MANLSIYDPFSTRLNTRLQRFFDQFGLTSPIFFDQDEALNVKLDVSEDDQNYFVHADLPGVKKDDIRVSVNGNQVSISAEVKREKEDKKDKNIVHCERYEGKVFRSFMLDSKVDEAKADAKFTDGVLELTLPKQAGSVSGKPLTIK